MNEILVFAVMCLYPLIFGALPTYLLCRYRIVPRQSRSSVSDLPTGGFTSRRPTVE